MKQYKTKTGVVLTCLKGGGKGNGRPRGIASKKVVQFYENRSWFEYINNDAMFLIRVGSFFEYKIEYHPPTPPRGEFGIPNQHYNEEA